MKKKYLLVQPNEDGNPLSFLDEQQLQRILDNPESYGITDFRNQLPLNEDPNYWEDGTALLLKFEVLKPMIVATAYKL
jgi:hypothetical protein